MELENPNPSVSCSAVMGRRWQSGAQVQLRGLQTCSGWARKCQPRVQQGGLEREFQQSYRAATQGWDRQVQG